MSHSHVEPGAEHMQPDSQTQRWPLLRKLIGGGLLLRVTLTQMGSEDLQPLDDFKGSISTASGCEAVAKSCQLSEPMERASLNDSTEMTVCQELVLSARTAEKTYPMPQ